MALGEHLKAKHPHAMVKGKAFVQDLREASQSYRNYASEEPHRSQRLRVRHRPWYTP